MCVPQDGFHRGPRPLYVCDRGLWPHNELHVGERSSLLVLVDGSGARFEVEIHRSWSLLLFVVSRTYVDDQPVLETHRGVHTSATLGALYGSLTTTFAPISPQAVRMYVWKIRRAVKRELARQSDMGRSFDAGSVINTRKGRGYLIGERGLDVYCRTPLLPVP